MPGIEDHEVVSVYPFSPEQIDRLLTDAAECVLMWGTQSHWPVGVYHAFVWRDGKIWMKMKSRTEPSGETSKHGRC